MESTQQMSQNFVIGFGGTGARCVETLAYVAASRSIKVPMHVLIVDPDESNGNVSEAVKQLRRYQTICANVEAVGEHERAFFSTPLNAGLGEASFLWTNPQPNQEFQTLIQYSEQPETEKALLNLLYDESDMSLTFEKGYIGRAHIGSLDLLRNLESQIRNAASENDNVDRSKGGALQAFFKALRAATQQPGGANLIVIGSIFGGTGASGLPAIPPLISTILLEGLDKQLRLGCVQLAPYFTFPQGHEEDPDSALHPLATQAALYHYALTDTGYDRIYLIGAPTREQSNSENVPGGGAQKNQAHYVELAAALAVANFFDSPPTETGVEVVACGSEAVTWDNLPARGITDVRKNLTTFATFCALHANFLATDLAERRHQGSKWLQDLESSVGKTLGGQEPQIVALTEFSTRFIVWAMDVSRLAEVDLLTMSKSTDPNQLGSVANGGSHDVTPYHSLIFNLNSVGKNDQHSPIGWYIEALTRASSRFCKTNYSSWWH